MKEETGLAAYKPLIIIIGTIFIAALALNYRSSLSFMHIFMGLFFVVFAMFKLFDLKGFAGGFAMYDLITKKLPKYAYAYPFIELALGLLYLSGTSPGVTDLVTVAIMFLSAAGIMQAISQGKDLSCSCLGTTLSVPLSLVSIIENVGMGAMALISLIF